ncbi:MULTISPECIES: AfsR/SARP family transcriptional regulator [unclassified Streptomyces]|uniref:AfsR/SARP family transcriptional regulator n=1 Tax=unclassified Streptomyces TaxID=2593676 RepID=UPI0033B7772E
MQFSLIGPFGIVTDEGETFAPNAPKLCQLLAVLALRPREPVAMGTLVKELWGQEAPAGAARTLQTHIYHARRMLGGLGIVPTERQLLVTQAPGYRLDVADEEVDVCRFERLVQQAQARLDSGDPQRAAEGLKEALALWRGPALSNVPVGEVLLGQVARIDELRIRALELRAETELRLGRHREFLPELRSLVSNHPLHEWLHGQLITALHRSGRRAEALEAYQNLYRILKRELGLVPSPELQRLQSQILGQSGPDAPVPLRWRADRHPGAVIGPVHTTAIAG